jgi:hypothetical protein
MTTLRKGYNVKLIREGGKEGRKERKEDYG